MELFESLYKVIALALLIAAVWALPSQAQSVEQERDHTLSPYFFVGGEEGEIDAMPLQSTAVETQISGVIAAVTVRQTYKNAGEKPLEAIYIFPASTRAAVHALRMRIGERTVVAQIRERGQARREYEEARAQGKSAALLEQERPNVFQMQVAHILPGDLIEVELRYTELLVPEEGVYEFVYPTVVGPRYSKQLAAEAEEGDRWIANPYLHEGEKPTYTFSMQVALEGGVPIQGVSSPSHQTEIQFTGTRRAKIALGEGEQQGGNRDFVLRYRLRGEQISSGLLLHEGEQENYFLLTMQPPERVQAEDMPPREYIFVVDVSGSMGGFPLNTARHLVQKLLAGLRPEDSFNVLLFAGDSQLLSEHSLPATGEHVARGLQMMKRASGAGGTDLLPALQRAMALEQNEGQARSVVVITDGYVGADRETFDLIRAQLGEANLFAFGIGSSVNRFLVEGMARAGMGEPFVVTRPEEAQAQSERFYRYINSPVLTDIEIGFDGFEVYDAVPPRVPDLLAERPVVIFGKWRGEAGGTVELRGRRAGAEYQVSLPIAAVDSDNAPLRYLWARHRIAELGDYNQVEQESKKDEITQLGLEHNLLTAYTSFVGIDSQVRGEGDEPLAQVIQPLPLPQGVSDRAVGGAKMMMARMAASPAPMVSNATDGGYQLFEQLEVEDDEPVDETSMKIEVSEGIDEAMVRLVLSRHLRRLRASLAGVKGTLVFRIDAKGKLIDGTLQADRISPAMRKKIELALERAVFAKTKQGGEVKVRFNA